MKGFWRFFRGSRKATSPRKRIDFATKEALHQLGNTSGWKQMYHVLKEWGDILLTDQAFAAIERSMALFESEGDLLAFTDWRQLLTMLRDAWENGIDEAWERFLQYQYMAKLALDLLLGAYTDEKRYVVLKVWQADLISDAAIVKLLNKISRAMEDHNIIKTVALQRLLRLLLQCRDYGLAIAWKNYMLCEQHITQAV